MSELPTLDPDIDPALAAAVLEIESHIAEGGWDQPSRLYALVDTAALVRREPALASAMGLDDASAEGSLTPVEQEQLPADRFEAALASIAWGPEVTGCAAVVERLVLPPEADDAMPEDPAAAAAYALEHPDAAGGPDGRGCHPGRGVVLCLASARARRRPLGRGRHRPGARADHRPGCDAGPHRRHRDRHPIDTEIDTEIDDTEDES